MPITTPTLPAKKGYVEVEINGEHKYKNVETGYILGEEPDPPTDPVVDMQLALEILLGGKDDELDDIISSNGAETTVSD